MTYLTPQLSLPLWVPSGVRAIPIFPFSQAVRFGARPVHSGAWRCRTKIGWALGVSGQGRLVQPFASFVPLALLRCCALWNRNGTVSEESVIDPVPSAYALARRSIRSIFRIGS